LLEKSDHVVIAAHQKKANLGPMNLDQYNTYCASLPHTAHIVQWGGVHVWKVGGPKGKMFALAFPELQKELAITFKVSPMSYDILKDQPGLRPAPYLASRGMTWIQRVDKTSMDDAALKDYLKESHRLCAQALPKAKQKELGLI
jgi:predicted DNA-binding protein (MmcQ/YjbR family)